MPTAKRPGKYKCEERGTDIAAPTGSPKMTDGISMTQATVGSAPYPTPEERTSPLPVADHEENDMPLATALNEPRAIVGDTLAIKQSVLADVSCVLARSGGADIDSRQAIHAARNICEILFAHPQQAGQGIPRLFWETPLGRAVGACYATAENAPARVVPENDDPALGLPPALLERLRREAEAQGKTISEWALEKLAQ